MKLVMRVFVIIVAAIVCAWAIRQWAWRPYSCAVAINDVIGMTRAAGELRGDYAVVQRADANLDRLRTIEPQCSADVRIYALMGNNEELAGRALNAVHAYEKALTLDPRPEIYVAMGNQLMQLGRIDEAVESFVAAARFAPGALDEVTSEEIVRRVRERVPAARR